MAKMSSSARAEALGRAESDFGGLGLNLSDTGKLDIDALAAACTDFMLLAALHFLEDVVSYLAEVSQKFQTPTLRPGDVIERVDCLKCYIEASYLNHSAPGGRANKITWGATASAFLILVPNLYSDDPGEFHFGGNIVRVTKQQVDNFLDFVEEYAIALLVSVDDCFPDQPILRSLCMFNPSLLTSALEKAKAEDANGGVFVVPADAEKAQNRVLSFYGTSELKLF